MGSSAKPMMDGFLFRWEERRRIPLPRAGCAAGIIGGRIVVAGGTYWADGRKIWCDCVDAFDPATDRWEAWPPMPGPWGDAAAVASDGDLHIFGGGMNRSAEASILRLRNREWTILKDEPMPGPRLLPGAVNLDGTFYVVGGLANASLESAQPSLWAWRPDKGWQILGAMPAPFPLLGSVSAVGGRIVVSGGCVVEKGSVRNLSRILAYDPKADAWSTVGQLPVPSRAASTLVEGKRCLYIGGYSDKFERDILRIDPATGEVAPAGRLPHGIADGRFFAIGRRIVGVTGECGETERAPWTLEATILPPIE